MTSDCCEWAGPRTPKGYGKVKKDGRYLYAHRVAYESAHGAIPDGLLVRHRCDNPPCVNPDHLEIGTQRDNYQDSLRRGRRPPLVTACGHGHAYDEANTYTDPRGRRHCRECERGRSRPERRRSSESWAT